MEIIKETKNMGVLVIKEIGRDLAKKMIIDNHYSHKWNTAFGKINIGIFKKDENNCLGVASFGNLMNPNSYKQFNDDFTSSNVIELNRLWIDDLLGKNAETILLGASWKIIRQNYPLIKIVQSFADGRLGCGTIYKASNFKYYGYSESLFYENIKTGITYHKVPMENTKRPKGMILLNNMWINNELKPFLVKTYRYIYPLYKNVKINLKEENYPEYDKGCNYNITYNHKEQLIFRSLVLSFIYDYKEYSNFVNYVKNKYTINDINYNIGVALENKSIKLLFENHRYQELKNHGIINNNTNTEQLKLDI